ncbi:hypothetical protein VNO77_14661 [Canavalia gladiata]|uniref:Leucine-rich repeat-containing N-terminal plant-type domain-containing protein n=1 Tax=Canavalia gladiata TaxID=3824 RepID=A0AAN9LYD5_CANGL
MTIPMLLLFTLLSLAAPSLSERCNQEDKKVLLQIKRELNNPPVLSSWTPNTDCCRKSWLGVECNPHNKRVISLSITNDNDLVAQFPPSIANLPYLESMFLYRLPNLTGPIPETISKLTKLQSIQISLTGLSGPLPNFRPTLKTLIILDLSSNSITGPLPPFLSMLPNLTVIFLNNNKLTGPIPYPYGSFKTLLNVDLSHNQLSGTLPMSLARLNLSVINLSHNRLEGDASMLFGSTKTTSLMDLSWNLFAFDMGKVELSKDEISSFDVSHNRIYGNLPKGIENVAELNVSYNRLCGEIPQGGNFQKFDVSSYFHNKCLCGSPLPRCKWVMGLMAMELKTIEAVMRRILWLKGMIIKLNFLYFEVGMMYLMRKCY